MNIVLTGYRGTGKSAVARLLAKKLGWQSLSLDAMIAQQEGRTISEIVAASGWEYFRDVEAALIAAVAGRDEVILDTGGGAILRPQNVQALRENGLVFWLKACPETIAARIKDSAGRPALTQGKTFLEEIDEVLAERTPLYQAAADFEIATGGKALEKIADDILYYFARIAAPAAPGLAVPERSRYLRQMLISGWGMQGQQRLRSATVFIAGAGGLGCPAALYLAAAGVGTIRLCDFGLVEASNLNRQILYTEADIGKEKALQAAGALRRANPHVTIEPLFEKIDDASIERLAGKCRYHAGLPGQFRHPPCAQPLCRARRHTAGACRHRGPCGAAVFYSSAAHALPVLHVCGLAARGPRIPGCRGHSRHHRHCAGRRGAQVADRHRQHPAGRAACLGRHDYGIPENPYRQR